MEDVLDENTSRRNEQQRWIELQDMGTPNEGYDQDTSGRVETSPIDDLSPGRNPSDATVNKCDPNTLTDVSYKETVVESQNQAPVGGADESGSNLEELISQNTYHTQVKEFAEFISEEYG